MEPPKGKDERGPGQDHGQGQVQGQAQEQVRKNVKGKHTRKKFDGECSYCGKWAARRQSAGRRAMTRSYSGENERSASSSSGLASRTASAGEQPAQGNSQRRCSAPPRASMSCATVDLPKSACRSHSLIDRSRIAALPPSLVNATSARNARGSRTAALACTTPHR